jgi:lysozyme
MKLDDAGYNLIKGFEGLYLHAYKDDAGVWTIGWGSTRYANGKKVQPGDVLVNRECADDLLEVTMGQYEEAVNTLVKRPISQNQFNACVSLAYNIGTGGFEGSSVLRELNAGNVQAAADAFLLWDKITDPKTGQHEVSSDLLDRRTKERALFLSN